jgi:chemotaxis protein MotB
MAMKKKAAAPEPAGESAPMWIVSFADLVTLLMSFFVVLYALKQDGSPQEEKVLAAIRHQFDPNYMPPLDSTSTFDQEIIRLNAGKNGPPLPNRGGNSPKPNEGTEGRDNTVQTIRPGKQIVTGGRIAFDQNDTKLDADSLRTVQQLADLLRGKSNVLLVTGHVSADEIRMDDPGGTILAMRRAQAVVEELVRLGIERKVLRPVGAGPYEPLKTGVYDQVNLRQNRRVEVYTTDKTASEYVPASVVPATGAFGGAPAEAPKGRSEARGATRTDAKPEVKPAEARPSAGH